MRIFSTVILCSMLSLPAAAQVTVIGDGLSRTCFEAVKYGFGSVRDDIVTCTRALEQTPLSRENRLATFVNRGILLMRDGKYDDALEDYETALRISDTNGVAWLNKGAALIYKKDLDGALSALNKAIEYETMDLHAAYYNRSLVFERQGDLTKAYWDLRKALELKPDFAEAEKQISRYQVEVISSES